MSEKLQIAREYEKRKGQETDLRLRPAFHVTAPIGWINDPNGFSRYGEKYHLFYQYHPYSTHWGPMHWGHSVTEDFIKWEQLPCAMAPDMPFDEQGCFSGSAIEHNGKHFLMYTGVCEETQENGEKAIRQTQCLAEGDGENYRKLEINPVITADMLPEGSSMEDFRDPRIWKEGDRFYAVVGSRNADGSGQIALFSSADIYQWKFEGIIDRSKNEYGKMWECPDFFKLEGKDVLVVSPQFMEATELEFHNGNNSVYFVGDFDRRGKKFCRTQAYEIDYGLDFYAPQTVEAQDGRRIMVGWLQSWDNYITPDTMDWCGMMTIPRELTLKDGRLMQNPVRKLEQYRKNEIAYESVLLDETKEISLDNVAGRVFDMEIRISGDTYKSFTIALAKNERNRTTLCYDRKKHIVTIDRTYSGLNKDVTCSRSMMVREKNGQLQLRILMDKYSVEVFANEGEAAMSALIYTDLSAEGIAFSSDGAAAFDLKKYDIEV